MPGRASYSAHLARLSQAEREAAIASLPERTRKLLSRTEIDHAMHKHVAHELHLSMRQFYRLRAAAVKTALAYVAHPEARAFEDPPLIPPVLRMAIARIARAAERADSGQLSIEQDRLTRLRSTLSPDALPVTDMMIAVAEVSLARLAGDSPRAVAQRHDIRRMNRDLIIRARLAPCASSGLMAMLSLANESLLQGNVDTALLLANDAIFIGGDLLDSRVQTEADIVVANALLRLPGHTDDAITRARSALRRCAIGGSPTTLIRALQTLATAFSECGHHRNTLAIRDALEPLAAAQLLGNDRLLHLAWSAQIELRCASPARAADRAEALRRSLSEQTYTWIAATIVRAQALFALGFLAQAASAATRALKAASESPWRPLIGESLLCRARLALATNNRDDARTFIRQAIPLLDRASLTSVQRSAYECSFDVTGDKLDAILAAAYT